MRLCIHMQEKNGINLDTLCKEEDRGSGLRSSVWHSCMGGERRGRGYTCTSLTSYCDGVDD